MSSPRTSQGGGQGATHPQILSACWPLFPGDARQLPGEGSDGLLLLSCSSYHAWPRLELRVNLLWIEVRVSEERAPLAGWGPI